MGVFQQSVSIFILGDGEMAVNDCGLVALESSQGWLDEQKRNESL
jgi:hypothetical protein